MSTQNTLHDFQAWLASREREREREKERERERERERGQSMTNWAIEA